MFLAAVTVLPLWASVLLAVASPIVAGIAVAVGLSQQTRTLRHERRRDDLSEVRSVLDDATRALHEADHRRRDIIRDSTTRRSARR